LLLGQEARQMQSDYGHPGGGRTLPVAFLARIIHERTPFANNAPAGAGSAAPAGFDPASGGTQG